VGTSKSRERVGEIVGILPWGGFKGAMGVFHRKVSLSKGVSRSYSHIGGFG